MRRRIFSLNWNELIYISEQISVLQEIKQVRDQLRSAQHDTMVDVQVQMADQSNDLLMGTWNE